MGPTVRVPLHLTRLRRHLQRHVRFARGFESDMNIEETHGHVQPTVTRIVDGSSDVVGS